MYYLLTRTRKTVVKRYVKSYIFDDAGMRENGIADVVGRLERVFGNKTFMRSMSRPANAWLDVAPEKVAADIVSFISSL